ncbi:hypothetical protein [Pseudomonas sp. AM14(2022)]|uniref:hypothetical protein n=1 Tax=Pseudomonas sp. AM14(2022) TaxID=2983371 RepID=UPI002E809A17|nr:hypothetical protein [Pseudomonas sp. AM14(2022)]
MNETVEDDEKGRAWLDTEKVQTTVAQVTKLADGSLKELGDGAQFSEVFWADAVETSLYQTHPRVPQLQTQMVCRYKFESGRIYVKTLRYKMTTRSGNWNRANIDVGLQARNWVRKDSPDSMLQDTQWHDYEIFLDSPLGPPDFGVSLAIRVNYDGTNNDVQPHEGWGLDIYPAQKPIIEVPTSGTEIDVEKPFTVSGSNGLVPGTIHLRRQSNNAEITLGTATVRNNGGWNTSIVLPPGVLDFYAVQIIGNQNSGKSNTVTLKPRYVAPRIDSPANGTVFKSASGLLIKGRGTPGKVIDVMTPGGAVLHATTTVKPDDTWEASFNQSNYPDGGRVDITAGHRDMNDWTTPQFFTLLLQPTITTPSESAVTDPRGPIEGRRAVSGATVEVLKDFEHSFKVGQGIADANGGWRVTTFTRDMPPGSFTIVARQTVSGGTSEVSVARSFKVRPPTLTAVSVTYPTLTTVEFSGAGFTGATVEITIVRGPAGATPPPAVVVTAGSWRTTSQNWPIGDYDLKVVQKVSDNAGGWIPSQEYLFKASSKLPPPSAVRYTNDLYTPTFIGEGIAEATVEVTDKATGAALAPSTQVTNQGWSTRAFEAWAPGSTRTVRVVQKLGAAVSDAVELVINIDRFPPPTELTYTVVDYKPRITGRGIAGATVQVTDKQTGAAIAPPAPVTGQGWTAEAATLWEPNTTRIVLVVQSKDAFASDPVEMTITVPLLAPVITAIEDDGLSPQISGTCWPGATLSLKYSDSATEHKPDGSSGTWTFKRDAGFAPDEQHTVTVIQTVAGRPSPPASQTFSVSPEKPDITAPEENADTHYDMTVRGINGYSGATLELRDAQFGWSLGEPKRLTAHGDWFIELKKLEFRKYQIDAVQTIAGRPSLPSAVRSFYVVLVPPVITVPEEHQSLARTSTLRGTGEPLGQVTIWRESPSEILREKVSIDAKGDWFADVTLPVGNYKVKARQFFDNHESKESLVRSFKVVPAAPVIESPGRGVHVGRRVVVSGFGVWGDLVQVTLTGSKGAVRASTPVLEDRTWSLTLETGQSGGTAQLVAVSSCDGFESAPSAAHPVELGTYLPEIDEPAPGRWVENPLRFVGKGRTGVGRVVLWFNPEISLSANIAVSSGFWSAQATHPLHPGGHWCRFQQTITDAADGSTLSDWVESERSEVTSIPPGARP